MQQSLLGCQQIVTLLVKKFPTFNATRWLVTISTRARHWITPDTDESSPQPHTVSSILKLSWDIRLRLLSGLFFSSFPTNNLNTYIYILSHTCYMPSPSRLP